MPRAHTPAAITLVPQANRPRPKRAVVYYPPALKQYTMDLLRLYKAERSKQSKKPLGWQTIRDQIMETEDRDERLAAEKRGIRQKRDKARSNLLTLDDLKGWFEKGKTHLPKDDKFQYIDRFMRSLRLDGTLDPFEQQAAASERSYVREALNQFYKPHHAAPSVTIEQNAVQLDLSVPRAFIAAFPSEHKDDKAYQKPGMIIYVILMRGDDPAISGFDIVACVPSSQLTLEKLGTKKSPMMLPDAERKAFLANLPPLNSGSLKTVLVYSGFLIQDRSLQEGIALAIMLARNPSNALADHVGFDLYISRYYTHNVSITGCPGEHILHVPPKPKEYFWRGDAGFQGQFFEAPGHTPGLKELSSKLSIGYRPC